MVNNNTPENATFQKSISSVTTLKTIEELVSNWWKLTKPITKEEFLDMTFFDIEKLINVEIPNSPPAECIEISDYSVKGGMVTEITFERSQPPLF